MDSSLTDNATQATSQDLQARDPLTGLISRQHFLTLLAPALDSKPADRHQWLLYLRPDGFGAIDDRFGPVGSDALLVQLGAIVGEMIPPPGVVSRFGGNTFIAYFESEDAEEAGTVAERLLAKVADGLYEHESMSTGMTVSIGVAEIPEEMADVGRAVSLAQSAARQARDQGGNRVHLSEPAEDAGDEASSDTRWQKRLRLALEKEAFRLVYQPVASLDGSANNNFDVLLRLHDKGAEDILPGEFMPAADRTGMMPAIDRWVIRNVFKVAASRHAAGKMTKLFLRVSEPTLHDPEFFGWLGLEALGHRLDDDTLVLLVNENCAEKSIARVRELAAVCKDLHLQIALSNSAAGPASLKLIQLLQLNYLVLDGSFIKRLNDSEERSMAESVLARAKERGVSVIATQIESAAELAQLYSLGVSFVIGFHVQEPENQMVDDVHLPASE